MPPDSRHDDDVGQRLRPYLDETIAHLPAHVEQRLAQARSLALSRSCALQAVQELVPAGAAGWAAGGGAGRWRMGLGALVLMLVTGAGGWWVHTQQVRNDEVEQDVSTLMGGTVGDKGELGALDAR